MSVNQHMKLSVGFSSEPPFSALVQQPSQHQCRMIPVQDRWTRLFIRCYQCNWHDPNHIQSQAQRRWYNWKPASGVSVSLWCSNLPSQIL